jgi:hypothetical protein
MGLAPAAEALYRRLPSQGAVVRIRSCPAPIIRGQGQSIARVHTISLGSFQAPNLNVWNLTSGKLPDAGRRQLPWKRGGECPVQDPRAGDRRPPSDSLRREDHRGCQQLLPRGASGDQLARYVAAANMTAKETVDVSSSNSASRPWTPAASPAGGGPGGRAPSLWHGPAQGARMGGAGSLAGASSSGTCSLPGRRRTSTGLATNRSALGAFLLMAVATGGNSIAIKHLAR